MLHPLSPPPLPSPSFSGLILIHLRFLLLIVVLLLFPILPPPLFLPLLFLLLPHFLHHTPSTYPTSTSQRAHSLRQSHTLPPSFMQRCMRLVNKLPPAMHYGCVSLLYRLCYKLCNIGNCTYYGVWFPTTAINAAVNKPRVPSNVWHETCTVEPHFFFTSGQASSSIWYASTGIKDSPNKGHLSIRDTYFPVLLNLWVKDTSV